MLRSIEVHFSSALGPTETFTNSQVFPAGAPRFKRTKPHRTDFISILIFVILFFISISKVQDLRNQKYYGWITTQDPDYQTVIKNESINKVYNHGIEFLYLLKRRFVLVFFQEFVNKKQHGIHCFVLSFISGLFIIRQSV